MTKQEFYRECFLLGLTLQETNTAEQVCLALGISYDEMFRQLEKPGTLAKLRILLED